MTVPVVIARSVVPAAGRAIARRISAWAATAEISQLNTLKAFLKKHPMITNMVGTASITSVIDAALNGDPGSIQALNDAADQVGINVRDSDAASSGGEDAGLLDRAVDAVTSVFSSDDRQVTDDEVEHARRMQDFARFIRGEISGDKKFVLRYHAMMREFLAMDPESLANLVEAY